jgi:hypothetical protein
MPTPGILAGEDGPARFPVTFFEFPCYLTALKIQEIDIPEISSLAFSFLQKFPVIPC